MNRVPAISIGAILTLILGAIFMGLSWNPANWKIVNTFQGQQGGYDLNPFDNGGDALGIGSYINQATQGLTGNTGGTGTFDYSQPSSTPQAGGGITAVLPATDSRAQTNNSTSNFGTFDPTSVAEANDIIAQANNLLGRLGNQRQIGRDNIINTFTGYRSALNNDFNRNEADYNTNRTQTIQDNERAKAGIDRKVAQRSASLKRFMGASGGGNSQAAELLAPYAVARSGTQMRNQVNQTFGRNISGLDQSFNRYKTDYSNALNSYNDQQDSALNDLEAQLLQQELSARDNLRKGQSALEYARTGNASSARALREQALPGLFAILQQIDALGKQRVTPQVMDAQYSAPQLAQYDPGTLSNVGGVDPVVADSVSPLYQYLLRKNQEDQNFFGY